MPPEVSARLDATLADLVAARSADAGADDDVRGAAPGTATVVALEERRRRRWPRVLVAAASVSVLAYGVGVALEGLQVSGGGAESTAARDETFAGGDAGAGNDSLLPEDSPKALEGHPGKVRTDRSQDLANTLLVPGTVRLHSGSLREEVQRLVESDLDARTPVPTAGHEGVLDALAACEQPALDRGDRIAAVRLDGRRATLVVRKGTDGTREAQIYACGDASKLLDATRLPSGH